MIMQNASDCLFCKIIAGQIPVAKLYEDQDFICIADIRPQAKQHYLIIPRQHIPSLDQAFPETGAGHLNLMGGLLEVATRVARQRGLLPGGFRTVINTGADGGQTVYHIHLHVLGGESLRGEFA